jgi:hypothetical protein
LSCFPKTTIATPSKFELRTSFILATRHAVSVSTPDPTLTPKNIAREAA